MLKLEIYNFLLIIIVFAQSCVYYIEQPLRVNHFRPAERKRTAIGASIENNEGISTARSRL